MPSANRGTSTVANQYDNGSLSAGQSANFGFLGTGNPPGVTVTRCSAA